MAAKRRIPSPDQLRDYNYAVAGHAGTLCDEDGELFIKPCTPSELSWYQAVEQNGLRDFAEVMPVFLGELRLSAPEDVDEAVIGLLSDAAGQTTTTATTTTTTMTTKQQLKASIIEQTAILESSSIVASPITESSIEQVQVAATRTTPKPGKKDHKEKDQKENKEGLTSGWVPSKGKRIKTDRAVVLGNASFGYHRANILDVKLGVRLWADDAAPEKKRRFDAITAETTHASLGFRIAGMRVFHGSPDPSAWDHEGYKVYDKEYGRTAVTDDNVVAEFRRFVFNKAAGIDEPLGRAVCAGFLRDLRKVEQVLLRHETRIYSSSLLFSFEGDGERLTAAIRQNNAFVETFDDDEGIDGDDEAFVSSPSMSDTPASAIESKPVLVRTNTRMDSGIVLDDEDFVGLDLLDSDDDDDDDSRLPPIFSLKMIDFAHAQFTPGQGPDENTLTGVRSLIRIFKELAGDS